MAFDIKSDFQRNVSVTYTKADGSAGTVEGGPEWDVSDEDLATVVVAADAMSAMVQHAGGTGTVVLTVRADGDLGTGIFPIVVTEQFNMLPPLGAVAGAFGVGEELPKPAA